VSFPVSDYGDYVDPGLLTVVGIDLSIGDSGLKIGAEGFESRNDHSDGGGDVTKPFGLMARVGYDVAGPEANSSPYIFGEVGVLVEDDVPGGFFSQGPDSGLALAAGAGFHFPVSVFRGSVEGRFVRSTVEGVNMSFFGITGYIGIRLGDRDEPDSPSSPQ
jgi:hypothetical protein